MCRGRVAGVSGCVAGVWRVCWRGVSGVCRGVLAGRVCVCPRRGLCSVPRGPRLPPPSLAAARLDGSSGPRGPRPPPPSPGRSPLRVSSTRVVPYFVCRFPRGPLGTSSFPRLVSGRCFACVPRDPRCRPQGTSSFPRGIRQTQTRVFFATCAAHVAFIRRRRPPHHTQRRPHTQLQFSPPRKKHPPAPRGPSTRPGMDVGRPPRCVRARETSAELCAGVLRACGPVRVVFHGLPHCAAPRRRQPAPCTSLPIKARCVSSVAHGRRRRPRV